MHEDFSWRPWARTVVRAHDRARSAARTRHEPRNDATGDAPDVPVVVLTGAGGGSPLFLATVFVQPRPDARETAAAVLDALGTHAPSAAPA